MANPRKEFSKIYDQYIDKIYRFIFLKVSSKDVAEDLTSETFLRAFKSMTQAPAKRGDEQSSSTKTNNIENPQAFLYRIARNLVTDHYREKGRTQIVSVEYASIIDPKSDLEEMAMLNSDMEQVRLAINNLKEDYQNVVIWYYLDDLPVSEIAKMLERSEEATRVLLHRALKALRKQLD